MPVPKLLHKGYEIGDEPIETGDDFDFKDKIQMTEIMIRNHFLLISIYIFLEILVARLVRSKDGFFSYFFLYLVDILFFYYGLLILMPYLYKIRKNKWKSIAISFIALAIHFSIKILIYSGIYADFDWFSTLKTNVFYASAGWRSLWILGLSAFYWDHLFIIKKIKRENILENEALHARISPHLLFNSLNIAYADTDPRSKGGRMLTLLGEFARYSMSKLPPDGKALLTNEIKQLQCLIKMNELRFPDMNLDLNIDVLSFDKSLRIPPQIIVSLAENLFKYGDLENVAKPAVISIWKENNRLFVHMENAKIQQEGIVSHKIGLRNVKQRLEKIYSRKYRLDIDDQPDSFKIDLYMPL